MRQLTELFSSEANDLAVRLARDFTQNHDVVVLDQYVLFCV